APGDDDPVTEIADTFDHANHVALGPVAVIDVVERVGNFRYRIVIPWPRSGAILEVLEMVPATG
ncbi:MAG TPA: hypothetical protein VEZ41_15410, partial [Allosphingosinicella sp.]|nr:hypothetical protein [Allosphingosinicella sp.]